MNEERFVRGRMYKCFTRRDGIAILERISRRRGSCYGRPYGSEWKNNGGRHQLKCTADGEVVFVGCLTSSGELIPNGETKSVNGVHMACKKDAYGSPELEVLKKPNEVKCKDAKGQERDPGVEWMDGSIQYKCDKNGEVAVVGCLASSGELIPMGDIKLVGGDDMECKMDANGKPVLKALEIFNRVRCKDADGQERDPGVEWKDGSIQYKCDKNGEVAVVGCLASSGELIPMGDIKLVGGDDMECKMDANGKPVLKALEIFNTVRCKDADGQERDPGVEWKNGSIQYKCDKNGEVAVVGCLASSGELIPMGDIKLVGGDDMECKMDANGKPVLEAFEKPNEAKCKDAEGEERDSGVEWQEGSIQYKCDGNGEVAFVGCLTSTGELIPIGETKSVDGEDMECKTDANGKPVLEAFEKPNEAKCRDAEGQERDSGVEWKDGSIQYKCDKNGEVAFVGCLASTGELIPIGETKSVDGDDMECKTDANGKPVLEAFEKPNEAKCRDAEGLERDSGVEWQEGSIQYKCDGNGEVAFVGCLTSTGELIPIGQAKSVDGDDMECMTDANGKPVLKALEIPNRVRCKDADGQERDPGSVWTAGWFQFKCAKGGKVELSGCFTSSGEIILRGERRTEDGRDLECKVDEKGSPFLDVLAKSSGTKCKDGEGKYRIQGNLSIIYSMVIVPRLVLSLGW
uniref:DUF4280 domain-containing protein n=1 Tax=Angiostrongylus cantonensis TaxID=6313 RepID=A0A0K0D0G5_ANGCA